MFQVWQFCGACDSPGTEADGFAPAGTGSDDAVGSWAEMHPPRTSASDTTTMLDVLNRVLALMDTSL
jgi:hypothetical protein